MGLLNPAGPETPGAHRAQPDARQGVNQRSDARDPPPLALCPHRAGIQSAIEGGDSKGRPG